MLRGKKVKPFWFSSLGQQVQFKRLSNFWWNYCGHFECIEQKISKPRQKAITIAALFLGLATGRGWSSSLVVSESLSLIWGSTESSQFV